MEAGPDIFLVRLEALLARRKWRPTDLSRETGLPVGTIRQILKGSLPSVHNARRIADALGTSIDWLSGKGPWDIGFAEGNQAAYEAPLATVSLPRFTVQASAGGGALVQSEEIVDRFVVSRDWLARYVAPGARAGIIEARGDSMEPTIRDGDILLLDFDIDRAAIDAGGVFVITVDGALLVKRLQATVDGAILVLSDNDYYQPERLTREFADERMTVHARVVWSGGPIRRRK